jgi:hypothetical protein
MTLDEFIQAQMERLERFRDMWIENNNESPVDWPMKLAPVKWEQEYFKWGG